MIFSERALGPMTKAAEAVFRSMFEGGRLEIFQSPLPTRLPEDVDLEKRLVCVDLRDPFSRKKGGVVAERWDSDPAEATGTARWYRVLDRDGNVLGYDAVGLTGTGAGLEFPNVFVKAGTCVNFLGFSLHLGLPSEAKPSGENDWRTRS